MPVPVQLEQPRIPPLQSGWLVVYRYRRLALCGGTDDREHGTVRACRWNGNGWTVLLTDGQQLPLSLIRAVGQTNETGRLIAAWTVREHGYDGQRKAPDMGLLTTNPSERCL